MAGAAANSRCEGRLGGAAARRRARRLGVPIRQRLLSRCRRHRRRRHRDGPFFPRDRRRAPWRTYRARAHMGRGLQSKNGGWGAFDATIAITTSTTFPSPITARCSIRRPDVSARCVSMLAQLGDTPESSARLARASIICSPNRWPTQWFGRWARITFTARGRRCARERRRPAAGA